MSDDEIKRIINDYIKRVSRLLPDNFETEDLLEELKAHISEGLEHKMETRPSEDPVIPKVPIANAEYS